VLYAVGVWFRHTVVEPQLPLPASSWRCSIRR
jgi:hypothetical protein